MKRKSHVGVLFTLILLVELVRGSSLFAAATLPQTTIIPDVADSFIAGEAVPFAAQVTDPSGVQAVRAYFRFNQAHPFVFIDLVAGGTNRFSSAIPALADQVDQIDYFFLVVNGQRQVIKTPLYSREKQGETDGLSIPDVVEVAEILTELQELPYTVNEFFAVKTIPLRRVPLTNGYGYLAGVYKVEDISFKTSEGFFGGFLLDRSNKFQFVPGLLLTAPTSERLAKIDASEEEDEVLGPDIRGYDWSGYFIIQPYGTEGEALVASITQNALGKITIETSKAEGIGRYFEGDIDEDGDIIVYDLGNDEEGNDWTTIYGPATTSKIVLADWVDTEYEALYQIVLTRDVPIEPEPEPVQLMPFLELLLM